MEPTVTMKTSNHQESPSTVVLEIPLVSSEQSVMTSSTVTIQKYRPRVITHRQATKLDNAIGLSPLSTVMVLVYSLMAICIILMVLAIHEIISAIDD